MKQLIFFLCVFLCPQWSPAGSKIDERRREFFHENIPAETKKIEKPLFEILSVSKNVVQGYAYEGGPGTRQVNCIEVKFKISQTGEMTIPYFYVYLYDSKKELVDRIERAMIKETTGSHEIDPTSFPFKGKRTYTVQFDYPSEIQFKYYLAVVGDDEGLCAAAEPGKISWKEFEFDEKDKIGNHSSSD